MPERDSKGCSRKPGQLNEKTIGGKDFPPRPPPLSTTVEWTCATRFAPVPWRAQLAHKIHLWSAAVGGIQTAHLRNGTCNQCTTTFPRIYTMGVGVGRGERRYSSRSETAARGKCFRSAYRPCRGFHLWDCMKNSARIFRDVSFLFFYNGPCYRRSAVSKPIAHSTVRTPPPLCALLAVLYAAGTKPVSKLSIHLLRGDITRTIPLEMI